MHNVLCCVSFSFFFFFHFLFLGPWLIQAPLPNEKCPASPHFPVLYVSSDVSSKKKNRPPLSPQYFPSTIYHSPKFTFPRIGG